MDTITGKPDAVEEVIRTRKFYAERLLDVAEELKKKVLMQVSDKDQQIKLNRIIDAKRINLMQESNRLDTDGKPVLKNAELREGWVNQQIAGLTELKASQDMAYNLSMLDAEIRGLEYEFKALRAVVSYESD